MILIAENLNIMSKTIGPAMRSRDAKPIQDQARAESARDVDLLDINIGPARKEGDAFMDWIVRTVQEVTTKPLSLDTTNPVAMEAGLKAHKGMVLINSISPVRADIMLPMVNKYNAEMIALLWGLEGMPRDSAERGMIAADLLYKANEQGIPNEKIWVDPIAGPVSVDINQVKSCFEFQGMLQDIAPGAKSTVGLSNISNGAPDHLRPYLNRTFLIMLMKYGLYSAIVDAFDDTLIAISRGKRPDLVKLVQGMMDGDRPDPASLDAETLKYYKTVKVLLGETLYSHSWLDV